MPPMLPEKRIKSLVVLQLLQADPHRHPLLWGVTTTEQSEHLTITYSEFCNCTTVLLAIQDHPLLNVICVASLDGNDLQRALRFIVVQYVSSNLMFSHRLEIDNLNVPGPFTATSFRVPNVQRPSSF